MRITLNFDGHGHPTELGSPASWESSVQTLRASTPWRALAKSIAIKSGFDPFSDPVTGDTPLREIADVAASYAPDFNKVRAHLVDSGLVATPKSFYDDVLAGHAWTDGPKDACVEAICAAFPEADPEEIADAVADALRSSVCDELAELPSPDWRRAIPASARAEMSWIPGLAEAGSIDDLYVTHWNRSRPGVDTVVPDESFARFLRLINMSSDEFLATAIDLRDDDLRKGPDLPPSPNDSYDIRQRRAYAEIWRTFHVAKDLDRPALLSPKEVVDIVENASYGGVPVFVCRVPLKDFLSRDPAKPATFSGGGFVGLHDFLNGSGHIEQPRHPLTIPNLMGWKVASLRRNTIDDVHGIVDSYYHASIADAPKHALWSRVKEGVWIREAKDGGHVEISRAADADGEEFWVQTLDVQMIPYGPRETPEVWGSFDDAADEGDRLATCEWPSSSPAP